jgi:hypothetical protein
MNTVAADLTINSFVIPDYKGTPDYAYVDIYTQRQRNQALVANRISTGYIGITDSVGTLQNAGDLPNGTLRMDASVDSYGIYKFPGYENVAQYLLPGATRTVKLGQIACFNSAIDLFGCYGSLRMYFDVR